MSTRIHIYCRQTEWKRSAGGKECIILGSIETPRQLPPIVLHEFRFCFSDDLCESDDPMVMNNTMHLRFIGVIPQEDCLEYGFRIEDKDKVPRLIVMMIESDFFKRYSLMFQEAPDLCYQKLLADLKNETAELSINPRLSITASDIAHYREMHPIGKASKLRHRNLQQ